MADLPAQTVRKVARLARLALTDEQAARYGTQLSSVLGYMDRLRELDLSGVEPMTTPGDQTNRLAEDAVGPTLSNEALMGMAPEKMPPFIRVPKVLGGEGGA